MRRTLGVTLATVIVATVIALLGSPMVVSAQQPTVKRTVLQRGDLSATVREAVMAKAEIPAGGSTGRHTHPGEEVGYVAQGPFMLDVEGQPSRTLNAGDVFMIPAGTIHNAINQGSGTAIVIVTYVVEKGKPLTTPVP